MSINNSKQQNNLQQWLESINCLQSFTQNDILNGVLVYNIISHVNPSSISQMKQLAHSATTLSRVNNWNILIQELKKLNIPLNQQQKAKIIAGNRDLILQIVSKLKQFHLQKQKSSQVDLTQIDPKKDVNDAKTLLEMLLILITKNFKLSAKEAVALLSNQSKYLAHILTKGLKGQFKGIQAFLTQLNKHQQKVLLYCQQSNQQNLIFFLRSIKPALISKSETVSFMCLSFFNRFLEYYPFKQRMNIFQTHLQSTYLLTIKRHPGLEKEVIFAMFEGILMNTKRSYIKSKSNSYQITSEQQLFYKQKLIKDTFNSLQSDSEKYAMTMSVIKTFAPYYGKIQNMLSIPYFVKLIWKCIDGVKQQQHSQICIDIVLVLCQQVPQLFSFSQEELQEQDDVQQKKSNNFVINSREISLKILENLQSLQVLSHPIPFVIQLFALLQHFGQNKHLIAPNLYKLILKTFSQVENSQNDLYQIYLMNFTQIIKEFPSIPWNPLLDHLLAEKRQSSNGQSGGAWFDEIQLNFLLFLLQQSNMDLKNALFIFNYVSKAFIETYHLAGLLIKIMLKVIDLFSRTQPIVEQLTSKLVKVCLAIHHANTKKLSQKRRSLTGNTKITNEEALMRIKNNSIQFFVFKLAQLHIQEINSKIEPLVAFNFIQMKDKSEFVKGFIKTLQEIGDFEEIIDRYSTEIKRAQQEAKQLQKLEKISKQKEKAKQKLSQSKVIIKTHSRSRYEQDSNSTNKEDISSNNSPTIGYKAQSFSMHVRPLNTSYLGITPSAQKGIQKFQKVYLNKLEKQDLQKIRVKEEEEREQMLKRIYKKKMVSHYGIDIKGQTDQIQYLFEFDSLEGVEDRAFTKISFYTNQTQQDRDMMACQKLMKLYQKPLKVIFSMYAGQKKGQLPQNFDEIAEKNLVISSSSVYKYLKDFGFEDYISLREVQQLSQKINIEMNQSTTDYQLMDFQGFVEFFKQSSFLMFTRPPKDLRGQPLAMMLQETFSNLKLFAGENKINEQIFEQPSNIYFNQTQAVAQLNKKLAKNPDYILPQGYKKIVDKRIVFQYGIFLQALSPEYKVVLQVIDELLFDALSVHIIQPFTRQQRHTRARPSLFIAQRLKISTMPVKHIPVSLKQQIMRMPIKSRAQAKQCAIVIDEMIAAIELGHSQLGQRHMNKVEAQRQKQIDQQKKLMEIQKRRRQNRNRQAKSAIQQYKQQNKQKEKQQSIKKGQQQKKLKQQKQRKEKQTQQLKRKIDEYNKKKKQDEQQKNRKRKQQQEKDKKQRQRLKLINQETKRKIQEQKKRKEQQEAAKKAQKQAQEKKMKQLQKKKLAESQMMKKKMVEEFKLRRSQLKTVIGVSNDGDGNSSSVVVGQEGKNLQSMVDSNFNNQKSNPVSNSKKSINNNKSSMA